MAESRLGWVGSSDDRGTLDIIWSCLATLALCVWTAVHPNIQLQPSLRHTLKARLTMMIIAVIFPEIIISSAWRQLETARWLRNRLRENDRSRMSVINEQTSNDTDTDPDHLQALLDDGHDQSGILDNLPNTGIPSKLAISYQIPVEDQPSEWKTKQAFFAVMGGFVVEVARIDDEQQPIKERHSLTTKGVEYLSLAGATPALSEEDVDERNNTDLFAKTIVVVQLSWFAIQIIARLVAKLPLSALEVHTVVHVICAMIMYAVWKDKPYALERPILLGDSRSQKVAALLICKDRLHEIHREQTLRFERARERYWINRAVHAARIEKGEISPDEEVSDPPKFPRLALLGEVLDAYTTADAGNRTSLFGHTNVDSGEDAEYHDDSVFQSLASDASHMYAVITKNHPPAVTELNDNSWSGIRQTAENFILRQVWGSWSKDLGHRLDTAKALHFLFNLGYGGLHLAAWNSSVFPTGLELLLWRISSIVIASVFIWGTAWVGYWMLARSSRSVRRGDWDIVFAPTFGWYILFFIMARCFLLIESVIGLRDAPADMYKEVRWTTGFPHAG